jgi:predicted enzyme related to lactoylglutathione lyase
MRLSSFSAALFTALLTLPMPVPAQDPLPAFPAPIVFFDIAGPDAPALRAFYAEIFGWDIDPTGAVTVVAPTMLQGQFRPDPAEKRIYLGVEAVAATLEAIVAMGGTVDAPRFEVPGVVVLGLFKDPAGNPMALVEMENGSAKIP